MKGRTKKINTARELCYAAASVAILAVCSWIAVPIGNIPVTLQSLGVCLLAGLLGGKRALLAIAAYLLLGFVGVPVFAGFTGGIGKLFTPTCGYLIGFLIAAPLCGWLCKACVRAFWGTLLAFTVGTVVCYAFGTAWFMVLAGQEGTAIGLWSALLLCVIPYIPFDVVKIVCAAFLTERLKDKIIK